MVWDRTNRPLWLRCTVAVLVTIIAAAIRWQFLGVLEVRAVFLTFYPAVAVAALYGGFIAGLLSTIVSAALADYLWMEPVGQFAIANIADQISLVVFFASGTMMSYMAEAAYRAQARANKAEEESKLATEREQSEKRLRDQREWFQVTLTSIGDAVLTADTEGKVTFLNPVAETLTGRTLEEAVGQPVQSVFRIINEQTRATPDDVVERVLREGNIVALANHTALVAPDGLEVPIEDSAAPIKDSEGNVSGVVVVFHDVTERRRAQDALRESEERLRLFIEHAPVKLAMFDREMRYLSFSRAWLSDYNLGDRDLTGLSHYDVFPEISEEWKTVHRRALAGEVLKADDDRFDSADGSLQWLRWEVRPWHDATGDVGGIVIFSEDITGRKLMEEELRDSKTKLQAALASMTDAVFISDVDGLFIDTNEAFATFLRFKNKDECFKTFAEYPDVFELSIDGKQVPPEMWPVSRALRGEIAMNAEYTVRRKDTGETWIGSHNLSPIRDQDGLIVGSVVTARDITEHKRMEEELRENQARLDLALRSAEMGVWHLDIAENKRVFDDQVCRLLGIDASKFTGAAVEFFDAVHPDDHDKVRAALAQTIEHGAPYGTEYRVVWPDGTIHHIAARGRPLCDDKGKAVRLNGLIWDVTERKRTEQELWESLEKNQFLADLIESSSQPLAVGYTDGRLGLVNTAFEQLTGYNGDELGSIDWPTILTPPEWQPIERLKLEELHRTGKPVRYQKEYIRKNGTRVPIELLVHVVTDPDGKPQYYYSYITDITERVRAEQELRKSRDELDLRVQERTNELVKATGELTEKAEIIDFAHDAIIIRDPDGRTVFWSKGAQETYGFSDGETLGQVTHDLLKAVFPTPLEEIIKTVLGKGEWKGEIKHTKANGERIVVDSRWAVKVGKDGEPAGFLEVNRDITARKIAQEEFRKADRAFRTLSECNQAMVRQTDEMEMLRQVCRIVVDVGGYRMAWVGFAENDENKTVVPVASAGYDDGYLDQAEITWADNERGRGPTGTAIRTGKITTSQNALSNPAYAPWRFEGTRRGYAASIALPLIVEKNVIGTLTIYASEPDAFDEGEASLLSNLAENLSFGIASIRVAEQRRRSEEELRVYASRLEVINRELQDFAFVAAHDLQEPLRKIQTFCDMAMKRCAPTLDGTGKAYLDRVLNSASRMRDLLRDLLQFSRVAVNPEPFGKVELNSLVREAADVFEALIKESDCRMEIENLPAIEADASQMLQLFQNLIGNALKFRGDGTTHIRIYGKSYGKGMCEISIEDNGIGFHQQFAEQIFKPFQRLHGHSEYDGTGMGLAICRKIVERHGGTIGVESEPGKGSKFMVRLPVKQPRLGGTVVR